MTKSLPKTVAAVALVLWWGNGLHSAADEPQDALWRKAVAVAAANVDWVPGLTVTRSEVLHKGQPVAVHEIWQRSKPGPGGEPLTEIVKILEDGEDVTKKEKKETKDKGSAKKSGGQRGGNPFDPGVQDKISLKVMAHSRTIAGRDCVGYGFEIRNTNGPLVRGTAWLEKDTGVPSEIENMTLDPLPDRRLKRLTLATRYETTTNGTWLAKTTTAISTMSVMFVKADARTTTTFSEHWKKPQRETTPGKERKSNSQR